MANKKTSSLRSAPQTSDKALDDFAAGARQPRATDTVYPWEAPYVREDVMKQVLLKMPEPLYLKLRHIANYTPYNMTSFILERIESEIEKEIAMLTRRG